MLSGIRGLHHVTSMARDAAGNNRFFTRTLGLRRVKTTVNFDAPDVYHLYYGDERGKPGSLMTCFPFPNMARGRHGVGEVGTTAFSVPAGAIGWWREHLAAQGVEGIERLETFGEQRLFFRGPDGEDLALVEAADDPRPGWTGAGLPAAAAIRGLHSVAMRLQEAGPTAELLEFMGYERTGQCGNLTRFAMAGGNGAGVVDIEELPTADDAQQGAGSVHHVAFAVDDHARQVEVRKALIDAGYQVTPVIDRDYFRAIYFSTPGGVLFEVATGEPGFTRDEEPAHLGEALKLPTQHAHLRPYLEKHLAPLA